MVEPSVAVGVHATRLGVTVGGAVPVATIVALVRVNAVIKFNNVELTPTVPEVSVVSGMLAGTAEIMWPSGIVAVAESVAKGLPNKEMVQLLIAMVSGAPTLSVSVTDTVEASQGKLAVPNFRICRPTVTPV